MARQVILVNGIPGSGKTTLAGTLAAALGATLLSKDRVKEALADAVGQSELERQLGTVAMEAVWRLTACVPDRVVIDSWWFRPRDLQHARNGLSTAGSEAVVEVWCDVPVALAQERYRRRNRHRVHRDSRDMTAEWAAWEREGGPLALGPVFRADTSRPVNVTPLIAAITEGLQRQRGAPAP